jgi:cyclomaltodextrinase / maltogenic alpha-amylase / neopullulanase
VLAIAKRWLAPNGDASRGVDGFRLDVPGDIPHPFWVEFRRVVKETKPDAYISGEIWQWAQPWLKGDQFDAVMNYQFAETAQAFFVNQKRADSPARFGRRCNDLVMHYPLQVALAQMNLFDSHDTDRLASMFVNPDLAYDAANRIQDNGPNYNSAKPADEQWKRMKQAVAFQMTFLGAPMIYYGDEAGMWGPDDPSNRQPMIWKDLEPYDDPDVAFRADLFEAYQRMIAIRNTLPALRTGFFRAVVTDDANKLFAFAREVDGSAVYVAMNRSGTKQSLTLPIEVPGLYVNYLDPEQTNVINATEAQGRGTVAIRNGAKRVASLKSITIELGPHESAVLAK